MNIMIHEITSDLLNFQFNESDVLTFDDGLYSIYYYKDYFKNLPNKKIIFLFPAAINQNKKRNKIHHTLSSPQCMTNLFINNDNNSFLSFNEIEHLINDGFSIGFHSFYHDTILSHPKKQNKNINEWRYYKYKNLPQYNLIKKFYSADSILANKGYIIQNNKIIERSFQQYLQNIQLDLSLSIEWFKKYFYVPNHYCAPFNQWSNEMISECRHNNINNLYGGNITQNNIINRIDINEILIHSKKIPKYP